MAHNPTPWTVEADVREDAGEEYFAGFDINDANGREVVGEEGILAAGMENAHFIVRAVNAHDEMLAALKSCREELWDITHPSGDPTNPENMDGTAMTYRQVVSAIAKAEQAGS